MHHDDSARRLSARTALLIATAVAGTGGALHAKPSRSFELSPLPAGWSPSAVTADPTRSGGFASVYVPEPAGRGGSALGDAAKTWVGPTTNNLISTASNWADNLTPVAGDDLNFEAAPVGDYAVVNDQPAIVYGNLVVNRATPTETVSVSGGFTGIGFKAVNGVGVIDGGTVSVSGTGATGAADTALIAGGVTGTNGTLVIQNNATVLYQSARSGLIGSTGAITVTGAGTTLAPLDPNGAAVVFGGSNSVGTSNTILVDNGASVTANTVVTGIGTFTIRNNATVSSVAQPVSGTGGGVSVAVVAGAVSTLDITSGGKLNSVAVFGGEETGSKANINIAGSGSAVNASLFVAFGGDASTAAGNTALNITTGGSLTTGQFSSEGGAVAAGDTTYTGTVATVSGSGSVLRLTGIAGATPEDTFGASMFLTEGVGTKSTINVVGGGLVDLLATAATPDQNGILSAGNGNSSVTTINVDGAGSTFNAGNAAYFIQNSTAPRAPKITNAQVTLNVVNGGLFLASDEGGSGNLQLGVFGTGTGNSIVVNIGGGTGTQDAESAVIAQGGAFLGGNGSAAAPTVGAPTTVNVNNGLFAGDGILVYQNSTINLNRGEILGFELDVYGGTVKMSPTAPAGTGVMEFNEYDIGASGYIDIGNSGGVSYYNSGATTPDLDLAEIRGFILAGYAGGAWNGVNGINSSKAAADARYAIGYADIDVSNITSFLGIDFVPADEAIVFRTTLKGDANVNGTVNFDDLLALAQNYGVTTGKEWFNGDFNYDGGVGFDDLLVLAQNYGLNALTSEQVAALGANFAGDFALAQSLVPEPAALGLIGGLAAVGLRRRQRA